MTGLSRAGIPWEAAIGRPSTGDPETGTLNGAGIASTSMGRGGGIMLRRGMVELRTGATLGPVVRGMVTF